MSTTSKSAPVSRPSEWRCVVRPVRVRRAGDVPGRAVVGEDHPVHLQRLEHDARLRRELRDVDARLQPHAQAHRRQRRARRARREVPRGIDVRAPRPRRGEAERVVDHAAPRPRPSARGRGRSAARRRRPTSSPPAGACPTRGSTSRPSPPSSRGSCGAGRTARRGGTCSCRRAARGGLPSSAARPRCGRSSGSGSARGPTRRRTRIARCDVGVALETTSNGIPIGPPSHFPEPKSGWSGAPRPIALIIAAEFFATGSVSTGVFHGLSAGKIAQFGAFGSGVRRRRVEPASSDGDERDCGRERLTADGGVTPPTARPPDSDRAPSR